MSDLTEMSEWRNEWFVNLILEKNLFIFFLHLKNLTFCAYDAAM